MKLFDVSWVEVLAELGSFEELDLAQRQTLLTLKPSPPIDPKAVFPHADALQESGMITPVQGGARFQVAPQRRVLLRVLRAMDRHKLFDQPSRHILRRYISEHFSNPEAVGLLDPRSYPRTKENLLNKVSSRSWLSSLLDPDAWEDSPVAMDGDTKVVEDLRALCRRLGEGRNPVPLAQLAAESGVSTLEDLAAALHWGLSRLVLFAALREDGLVPAVGLWPPVAEAFGRGRIASPRPVEPGSRTLIATCFEDMTTLVVACCASPPRLTGFRELFVKAEQKLRQELVPVPEWLEEGLEITLEWRLRRATDCASRLELVQPVGTPGRDYRLEASAAGQDWLKRTEKERLCFILDHLKGEDSRPRTLNRWQVGLSFAPEIYTWGLRDFATAPGLTAAYTELVPGEFVRLNDFLDYHSVEKNPIKSWLKRDRGWVRERITVEEAEQLWRNIMVAFLVERLQAFGAVHMGFVEGDLCLAISDIGRYLLGQAADFEYVEAEGEVLVQPNFEVVFLSPSPRSEATIGRFATRLGSGVGTLLRITKQSVLGAAAGGLTADHILRSLDEATSKPVPENVKQEIRSWLRQTRRLELRTALLLVCPDKETAARVASVNKKKLRRLSDTLVEVEDPAKPGGLTSSLKNKLRDHGLFVDERLEAEPG